MDPACLSDTHVDPWTHAMLRGDFAAAWEICDRVLEERLARKVECWRWPRHQQFIWRGQPVDDKRVLVRCYHGLGDTVQFARLLAPLRKRARHVALWVQPALLSLLQGVAGIDELHVLHDGTPALSYDVDVEIMELPHLLRLTLADLPGPMPYLHLDRANTLRTSERLRIGLAWRGGDWNENRSIPAPLLTNFERLPDVQWFSLQYGHAAPSFMTDIACLDIRELALRMLDLDLVISVDTMTAHLAGALALPTWTLLPQRCDWRWMRQRDDTPWYPTMKLFRQRSEGDWADVVGRVVDSIGMLASTRALDTHSGGYRASSS